MVGEGGDGREEGGGEMHRMAQQVQVLSFVRRKALVSTLSLAVAFRLALRLQVDVYFAFS